MSITYKKLKPYGFSLTLIFSILLGGIIGYFWGEMAQRLKPLGDIFLNLIFTTIVPLIFFSISSAIAKTGTAVKLGKIFFYTTVVFLFTGTIAAIYAVFIVKLFPPAQDLYLQLPILEKIAPIHFADQIIGIFTVTNFAKLWSHEHLLALIGFSILVGFATKTTGKETKLFVDFLQAGEDIFMQVFSLIMYYAPIGFFAYFAFLVSELGPKLMENYLRIGIIYYLSSCFFFLIFYTFYAYLAGKCQGIKLFWKNIMLPMTTALATCSSAASIPANLTATKAMRISPDIYEIVIPLGTIMHKEGSIIGGIFKIAFLFGIYHLDFNGMTVLFTALGVSLLVGSVMGAIPSGGMLGELLILAFYGFPPSVLVIIAAISIIIDPLATMLNVTGNSVSTMMIARLVETKNNKNKSTSLH